jgi:hypothetical protein
MISLLEEIKEELAHERKNKLRNALILATAIVMFAVPLNFAVEISANYIDGNAKAPETFTDYYSYYFWVFCFCMGAVLVALSKFYFPISRIFMNSYDWEAAFEDIEKEGEDDEYHMHPDGDLVDICDICSEEFQSFRRYKIHEEDCRTKNPTEWKKLDEKHDEAELEE